MKDNKGCAGGFSIIIGVMCFIFAFFSKQGADSSKGASITSYIGGKKVSSGTIGGNSEAVEFYEVLFYAFIISGIILVLLGVVLVCVSSAKSTNVTTAINTNSSSKFIRCPNCGEENDSNNQYCYKCKTFLNNKHATPEITNSWICPNCKELNAYSDNGESECSKCGWSP